MVCLLGVPLFHAELFQFWTNRVSCLLCLCRSLCDIKQHGGTRYFWVCLHKDAGNYTSYRSHDACAYLNFLIIFFLKLGRCVKRKHNNLQILQLHMLSYIKCSPFLWTSGCAFRHYNNQICGRSQALINGGNLTACNCP